MHFSENTETHEEAQDRDKPFLSSGRIPSDSQYVKFPKTVQIPQIYSSSNDSSSNSCNPKPCLSYDLINFGSSDVSFKEISDVLTDLQILKHNYNKGWIRILNIEQALVKILNSKSKRIQKKRPEKPSSFQNLSPQRQESQMNPTPKFKQNTTNHNQNQMRTNIFCQPSAFTINRKSEAISSNVKNVSIIDSPPSMIRFTYLNEVRESSHLETQTQQPQNQQQGFQTPVYKTYRKQTPKIMTEGRRGQQRQQEFMSSNEVKKMFNRN